MPEAFVKLPEVERVELTLRAKARGVPLVERWNELDVPTSKEWLFRSRLACEWLTDAEAVADLGCGRMLLETCMRPGPGYTPVDCVPRDSRTVVVDFNVQPLPRFDATHFGALGLFEYLYDLEGFLTSLRAGFKSGVATFYTRLPAISETRRLANGWVNHQTHPEFREVLTRCGFTISREAEFRPAHFLFRLD